MTVRFSVRALVVSSVALCLSSSIAHAQDASAPPSDASAPSSEAGVAATLNTQIAPSIASTSTSSPPVFSPPACTVEQLETLAQSAWWEGLAAACASLTPMGMRPLDPPSASDARVWHSLVGQCRTNQGRSARLLCDVPEATRAAALNGFAPHIRVLTRRALGAQTLCPRIEALRTATAQQPEASRAAWTDAVAQLETFCSSSITPLPSAAAVALLGGAAPGGQDSGRGEGGQSGGIGGLDRTSESSRQSVGGLPTPAGMLDLAIQGLAQLIAQRAQAELEAFAIDALRASLCSEHVRPWFEHTCDFLGPGGDTTLRVSVGQGLRSAFQSDVLALPTRALSTLPRSGTARGLTALVYFDLLAAWVQNPDPRFAASRVLTLAESWEAASAAPEPRRTREINASRAARDAVLGAGLLLSAATNRESFDRLPDAAFVPLVSAMLDRDLTDQDRRKIRVFRSAIAQYRSVGQGVRVTGRGAVEINATRAAAALRAVVDLLNASVELACADRTIAAMVVLPGRMPELIVAISRGDLSRIVVETTRALAALSVSFGLPESVVRGLVLAAEVASAQSAEQVRAALEAVVAPVGSWRMKRRRPMVSLGALVGVGGGAEWTLAGGGIVDPRPVGSVSLLGAVGLDVSFPVRSSTIGGFLSVVDLGGLMSLPTGDLQATVLGQDGSMRESLFQVSPRVSPEQVLSPGLYFRWGIFSTPLVLAVGGSITPAARQVQELRTDGGMPVSQTVSVFRAGAFLSADVTLFPF
ncbi:MAG: hypothetical protein JNK05_14285 [Myxococcales bacterium]|nr:hypothetical protein [Myxococcales bacterium]